MKLQCTECGHIYNVDKKQLKPEELLGKDFIYSPTEIKPIIEHISSPKLTTTAAPYGLKKDGTPRKKTGYPIGKYGTTSNKKKVKSKNYVNQCLKCGRQFYSKDGDQKFCSQTCYFDAKRGTPMNSPVGGTPIIIAKVTK